MSLSPNIKASLQKNAHLFLKIIPVQDLLNLLQYKEILSDRHVEEIKRYMNAYVLNVLINQRGDKEFRTFCHMLEENGTDIVKRFAAKLLADANGKIMY